jgi:hypothetical protein
MFNCKRNAKKFSKSLHAPRKLRSSAPSVLFELGPKNQPFSLDLTKHKALPIDLTDSDASSTTSESSSSSSHGPAIEAASGTSYSDVPPTPPSTVTEPPASPESVEPVGVVVDHIQPDSDDEIMAESLALGPPVFTGTISQEPKAWLNNLQAYSAYKDLDDTKKLALFKLRLDGYAREWLTTLAADKQDTFAHLSAAFLETFQPRELEKFRFAKELFNLKQQPEQSVDAFITQIKVKAALVGMDAKSQMWAALNGLLPHISAYVIEHAPESLDDILKHARIVEMTRGMGASQTNDSVSKQLDQITQQMSFLTSRVSAMTTTAVSETHEPRSADRHVNFRTERSTSPYQTNFGNKTPPRSPEPVRRHRQQNYAQTNYSQNAKTDRNQRPNWNSQRSTQASCHRCGRAGGHDNPLYCPMLNQECFACGKRGHSYRVCRSNQTRSRQN